LFAAIFVVVSSCVSTVNIPVLHQPEITLNEEKPKIIFISNFDPARLNLKNEKEREIYYSGAGNVFTGLLETFKQDSNIVFENCASSVKTMADSLYQNSSNPGYIKYVCEQNEASYLLVMDTFVVFFNSNIDESGDDFDTGDDSDELKFRDFTVVVQVDFLLYNKEEKLINGCALEETKHHKSRPVLISWIEITPAVKKAGDNIDKAARSIGVKYRAKFYGNIENVTRNYYADKDFREVKSFMINNDWIKAREALLLMTKSENPDISQKKVAHNLGVVYEALGDIESSDYWYQKSGNSNINAFQIK
jgi:hypothetical protein